jgi:hypothetical protein
LTVSAWKCYRNIKNSWSTRSALKSKSPNKMEPKHLAA